MRWHDGVARMLGCVTIGLILAGGVSRSWSQPLYRLDEAVGTLTVTGHGRPPPPAQHPAQARLMAERAAIVDAYGTASRLLSEAIPEALMGPDAYSLYFRGGRVVQSDLAPDGSVRVQLEIPVSAELVAHVRTAAQRRDAAAGQEGEKEWISHDEYVARHRVRGPRVITTREWIERYRSGAWVPYHR